jgi:hypothetical protein
MKVICVNKYIIPPAQITASTVDKLIIGQKYTVSSENKEYYHIKEFGDFGFYKYRFVTEKEYRKLKLKKLNEINLYK